MRKKILLAWGGGKDSTMALHELRQDAGYEIIGLLCVINQDYDRISLHGVRSALLKKQGSSLGLPIERVMIAKNTSSEDYDAKMMAVLTNYLKMGVEHVAFGDIYLEDVKKYREQNLSKIGMSGLYPMWGRNTTDIAHSFVDLGYKAEVVCVDLKFLTDDFVGRSYDKKFISELPESVDPCGENGEFHTFVYHGPSFKEQIPFQKGEIVLREERFFYCDLIPGKTDSESQLRGG